MANNNNIEKSAVNSVEAILNDTGYIDPYIHTDDKEPIWDGFVYIYNNKEKHNNDNNYQFRIPVQVKGTLAKIENNLKYDIKVSHLKSYLRDGGVLYFVVQVDKNDSKNNKIFYIDLHPFNITSILQCCKFEQQRIGVSLKSFPKDKKDIVNILHNFYLDINKQKPYSILINSIKQVDLDFSQLFIYYSTPFSDTDIEKLLLNYDGVGYIKSKSGIDYPFQILKPGDISVTKIIKSNISIRGVTYFNEYELIRSKNEILLILGKSVILRLCKENKISYSYKTKGLLSDCIKNLTFFVESLKSGGFSIDGNDVSLTMENKDISQLEKKLDLLKKLQSALTCCHLTKELNLNELTKDDYRNINVLIKAFVDNEKIAMKTDADVFLLNVIICDQRIICIANKSNENLYTIIPFSPEIETQGKKSKQLSSLSPYVLLKYSNLRNALNINFSNIVEDVKKYEATDCYIFWLNAFVLQLLLTYDETKQQKILNIAYTIMLWIEKNNTDKNAIEIYHLNIIQCKKRKNPILSEDDKNYLYEITGGNYNNSLKCGASILLGESKRAEYHFELLDENEQTSIKNAPIYNLWKDLNNG